MSLLRTQEVLSDYIEFNGSTEKFTKYVEDKDEKQNKRDNKKHPDKK